MRAHISAPQLRVKVGAGAEIGSGAEVWLRKISEPEPEPKNWLRKNGAGAGAENLAPEKKGAGAEFCKILVLVLYDVKSIYLGSVSCYAESNG